jgi:hypothetical protein
MIPLSHDEIQLLIAAVLFLMGCLCFLLGTIVLMTRGYTRELKTLAAHTVQLGQKGVSPDVSGLVSSASDLVNAINALVRTASGVGAFLMSIGLLMMAASYWIFQQVPWPIP